MFISIKIIFYAYATFLSLKKIANFQISRLTSSHILQITIINNFYTTKHISTCRPSRDLFSLTFTLRFVGDASRVLPVRQMRDKSQMVRLYRPEAILSQTYQLWSDIRNLRRVVNSVRERFKQSLLFPVSKVELVITTSVVFFYYSHLFYTRLFHP